MSPLYIFIGFGVVIAFYVIGVYNGLQTAKTRITAAIQEIGNQLKRQANLIPNLETAVKAYLKHEKGIFELLANARTSVNKAVKDQSLSSAEKANNDIQKLLPKIQVLVESNPQLSSNETVTRFMDELRDTADKLTYSRSTFIDLVMDYNRSLVTFPSNIVANAFGFTPEKGLSTATTGKHLEVSEDETREVKVSL